MSQVTRLKALLSLSVLLLFSTSLAEEEAKPIRISAMFELMNNQAVTELCNAPEFKACFDVPFVECSNKLKEIMTDCQKSLGEELPRLIKAEDADPIIEKIYACAVPAWSKQVESRKTNTAECQMIEELAKRSDGPSQ